MSEYDPNIADEFIYCIVIVFDEILQGKDDKSFFTSQKALCIMTKHRYFDVYLSFMSAIFNLYKLERFNILNEESKIQQVTSAKLEDSEINLFNEIKAAVKVPLIFREIEEILKSFTQFNFQGRDSINFKNDILRCSIHQKIPQSIKESQIADMMWLSPMFLSALTSSQFLKILYAMMLEKSIIFVSDNLPLLSSAVLGMQCFLHPFKWSYVQIPILPQSLVDIIEAPMPFIIGLLRSHLRYVPSLNESQRSYSLCEGFGDVEKLIVYINDQT